MNLKFFSLTVIVITCVTGAYLLDEPYRKQVAEFTEKCHKEHGVVIQEHNTKNLLCFPSDA
jgi:hypothetical protein